MKPFKLVLPSLTEEQKKGIGRLEKQGFWMPLRHQRRGNPDGFGSEIYMTFNKIIVEHLCCMH